MTGPVGGEENEFSGCGRLGLANEGHGKHRSQPGTDEPPPDRLSRPVLAFPRVLDIAAEIGVAADHDPNPIT